MPTPSMIGTAKTNIIVTPWTVNKRLYWSGLRKVFSGYINCVRISSAAIPANAKKVKPVTM